MLLRLQWGARYQRRRGRDKERDQSPREPENLRSAAPGFRPEATSPPPCPGCRLLPSWPDPHGPLWKGAELGAKEHKWAPLSPLYCLGKDSLKAVQVHCLGLEISTGRVEGTGAYQWQAPPFRAPTFSYRGSLSETSEGWGKGVAESRKTAGPEEGRSLPWRRARLQVRSRSHACITLAPGRDGGRPTSEGNLRSCARRKAPG